MTKQGEVWRDTAVKYAKHIASLEIELRALEAERDDAIASEKRARLMLEGNEFRAVMLEEEQRRKKAEAERDALKDAARALDAALNRFANWLILRAPVDNTPSQRGVMGTDIDDARKALRTLLNKEPG